MSKAWNAQVQDLPPSQEIFSHHNFHPKYFQTIGHLACNKNDKTVLCIIAFLFCNQGMCACKTSRNFHIQKSSIDVCTPKFLDISSQQILIFVIWTVKFAVSMVWAGSTRALIVHGRGSKRLLVGSLELKIFGHVDLECDHIQAHVTDVSLPFSVLIYPQYRFGKFLSS